MFTYPEQTDRTKYVTTLVDVLNYLDTHKLNTFEVMAEKIFGSLHVYFIPQVNGF